MKACRRILQTRKLLNFGPLLILMKQRISERLARLDAERAKLAEELAELEKAAGDCESREDAEQRIQEDPLSIEMSGTWEIHGTPTADKAIILLGTGGPATRIVCELDNGEPTRAWIESQDWFKPWTEFVGSDSETLLTYCRCFYFGEG